MIVDSESTHRFTHHLVSSVPDAPASRVARTAPETVTGIRTPFGEPLNHPGIAGRASGDGWG